MPGYNNILVDPEYIDDLQNHDCFLAGTLIDMWPVDEVGLEPGPDGTFDQDKVRAALWQEPIRDITPSDWVVSFESGMMVPGKVTRIFENESCIILGIYQIITEVRCVYNSIIYHLIDSKFYLGIKNG